jgi:type IV secretory pathway TraG/TraD family ATPase VirD4
MEAEAGKEAPEYNKIVVIIIRLMDDAYYRLVGPWIGFKTVTVVPRYRSSSRIKVSTKRRALQACHDRTLVESLNSMHHSMLQG